VEHEYIEHLSDYQLLKNSLKWSYIFITVHKMRCIFPCILTINHMEKKYYRLVIGYILLWCVFYVMFLCVTCPFMGNLIMFEFSFT